MTSALRYLVSADDKASATFRRIRGEIAGLQSSTASLSRIIGPLGPQIAGTFTVAALGTWIKRTVEGVDALNDLADATGDTVENLSALEDVALRTGTSMDTAGDAVIKLNKALFEAARDPDSQAGIAVKNLGLNIKDLLALSPVERLQAVGRALNSFGGENKLAYNLALLGKSTKEMSALLKDLAEAGKLNATVTTQQAEEAEKFNKQLLALEKNLTDVTRGPTLRFVSELNEMLEATNKAEGGLSKFLVVWKTLVGSSRDLQGGLISDVLGKSTGGASGSWDDQSPAKPSLPALPDKPPPKGGKTRKDEIDDATRALASYVSGLSRAIEAEKDLSAEQEAQSFLQSIGVTGEIAQVRELVLGLAAEKDMREDLAAQAKLDAAARAAIIAQQIADQEQLNRLLALTPTGQEKERLATVLLINKAFDAGAITLGQWVELTDQLDGKLEEIGDQAKNDAKEIGLIFASAAGEAITHWEGFGSLIKGILQDVAQLLLKKTVTDPLSKGVGDFVGSINWGSIIASMFGGGLASGGSVQAGRFYEVNERDGPGELLRVGSRQYLMPRADGQVIPTSQASAQAAGGATVVFNIGAGSSVDDWRRSERQVASSLQRSLRRAGAIA